MINVKLKNLEKLDWWKNHYRIDFEIKSGANIINSFDIFDKQDLQFYLKNFKDVVHNIQDFIDSDKDNVNEDNA